MAETKFGFPKGRVAKTLREILKRDLSANDVEAITIVLLSHLMIEDKINELMYQWLSYDIPEWGGEKSAKEKNKRVKDKIREQITEMSFSKKYALIEPIFKVWKSIWGEEVNKIWKINDLRNDIFHGKKSIKDVKFEGKSIGTEEGIEWFFMIVQSVVGGIGKLAELIDGDRAVRERWGKRLKELGEPLH